jgi:hypothetical protein
VDGWSTGSHRGALYSAWLVLWSVETVLMGVLVSGVFSDFELRRGASLGVARKGPIVAGLLVATAMLATNYTDSTSLVIVFLSIAFLATGWRRTRARPSGRRHGRLIAAARRTGPGNEVRHRDGA